MSVKSSKPSTTRQSVGLKMSETFSGSCAVIDPILRCPGIEEGPDRVCAARAAQYEMDVIYPFLILSIRSGIALEGFGPFLLKAIFGSLLLALIDAS